MKRIGLAQANITRGEWVWAAGFSLLALLASSAPYLAGYLAQTPNLIFSGAVANRPDYEVHLSSIHAGLRGQWTYSFLHSAQPATPLFIKTFYILIGQIGRILPLPAAGLYQAARVVCGFWALMTLYALAARFLQPVALRRAALAFYAFGAGLGWLMFLFHFEPTPGVSPIDFWLIDLYGFYSLMLFPHFMAVAALLWTAALAVLNYWRDGRWGWLALGAGALVLAQMAQSFAPLIVDSALGLYAVAAWLRQHRLNWRQVVSLGVLAVSQVPLVLITAPVVQGDPLWRSFSLQNTTPSPAPVYYILGLGLLGVLAVWGAWRVVRRQWSEAILLVAWIAAVSILVYLPLSFQRRFTEAVLGPVAVLAAIGLGWGLWPALNSWRGLRQLLARLRYPRQRARGLFLMLMVVAAMPSSLYLAAGTSLVIATHSPRLFDSSEVVQAVDWLGEASDWDATVLSAERTGSLIAGHIGHRVVLGHAIETVNYAETSTQVGRFYGSMIEPERRALLKDFGVRYVFWGPAEQELGSFDPAGSDYLLEAFRAGDVAVYEVLQP